MLEQGRPIKALLREPPIASDLLWFKIQRGRSRLSISTKVPYFSAAIAGAFIVGLLVTPQLAPGVGGSRGGAPASALMRADGSALGVLDAAQRGLDVVLSDGSRIAVARGARLRPTVSDGQTFRSTLERGEVTFDVKPRGPRRWLIDAGDTQISVLGTRFSVQRKAGQVTVAVERGRVEVRGSRVAGGARELGAGERIVVDPPPTAAKPPSAGGPGTHARGPTADTADAADVLSPTAIPDRSARTPGGAPDRRMRSTSAAGNTVAANAEPRRRASAQVSNDRGSPAPPGVPGPNGPTVASKRAAAEPAPTVARLLEQADAARFAAEYGEAERLMLQLLEQYPQDPQAGLVALTLGRLQLDQLRSPNRAAISLARANTLGLPSAVAEEGAARLVEAHARAGQMDLARAAATRYLQRFGNGPRRANVEAWIATP
jgi:transmembrane sensor